MLVKATFQKNVLVYAGNHSFQCSHTEFWQWVHKNNVEEFNFRPTDISDEALIKRRVNKVIKQGFEVSESGEIHHFKRAKKVKKIN